MSKILWFLIILAFGTTLVNCFLFPKRMANRTLTLYNSDFLMNNITTGVKLSKVGNDLKFLWTEEFNNKNNSFKVYVNFFFANSGIRQIVTLDNACGTYKNGSIEYFLQKLVLGEFANTAKCPIKPGATATFAAPLKFPFLTPNFACGPTYAMYNVFKLNPKKPKITPALFIATFTGHVTGPNCYPKAKFNQLT